MLQLTENQETEPFVSKVVVFVHEVFRGGFSNVSIQFVPHILMLMVLRQRQSAIVETCCLHGTHHTILLSALVYMAFSCMSNYAHCCRSNIDYARSVFLVLYFVDD